MSTFRAEYKEQMNEFCDANCKTTAEDILKCANEKTISGKKDETTDNVVDFTESKKKKKAWKALVPAACFLLIGTTALASTSHLGWIFRNIFKDETTAEIVDAGYLYEVHQTVEQDIFEIELVAVTGDAETPMILFDVYVNDAELVARNDQIRMLAYNLGVEQYENELDKYTPCDEAYGVKDKNIDNLYHVSMVGAPYWMNSGEPVVVDISQIDFDLEKDMCTTYELNMEYRFTPPQDAYYPVVYEEYKDMKFTHDKIDYHLTEAEYGYYKAVLRFEYDYTESEFADEEGDYGKLTGELNNKWLDFISTVTLVVDGKIYTVNEEEQGYTWCDEKGKYGNNLYFPSFNYEEATSIVLKAGDVSYTLK